MFLFICLFISTLTHGFLFYSACYNSFLSLFILVFSFVLDLARKSSFKLAPVSFSSSCVILWAVHWIILSLPHPKNQPFLQGCLVLFSEWWRLEAKIWVLGVLNLLGCCCLKDFSVTGFTPCPLLKFHLHGSSLLPCVKWQHLAPSLATVYPSAFL